MSTAGKKTYQVAISRPVIQSVIIEVEAENDEEAAEKAIEEATLLPEDAWDGDFDSEAYGYDVVGVEANDDIDPGEESFLSSRVEDIKYLLLRADTNIGEGGLLFQPWLHEKSSLFVADVCGDWLKDLQLLADEGIEGVYEWLEDLAVDATVIPPEVTARLPWIWQQKNKNKD